MAVAKKSANFVSCEAVKCGRILLAFGGEYCLHLQGRRASQASEILHISQILNSKSESKIAKIKQINIYPHRHNKISK
jgi:hypothetical protein